MAAIRAHNAARLLQAASASRIALCPAARRYQTTSATPTITTGPAETSQPDYTVAHDKATSYELPRPSSIDAKLILSSKQDIHPGAEASPGG